MRILQIGGIQPRRNVVAEAYPSISQQIINIGKINPDKIKEYKWGDNLMN